MAKRNKKQRTDIIIQGNVATWNLHYQGAIMGTYMGQFTFRCFLSPLQSLAASREFRELLGPNTELATDSERFIAYALSQLRMRILTAPPFWTASDGAGDIPDFEVLTLIMGAATDAEVKFREMKREERDNALKLATASAEKILKQQAATADEDKDDEEDAE